MPSVPTLISGGISIGIIASFISGVYYVLIAGLKWMGRLQESVESAEVARVNKKSCARCSRVFSRVRKSSARRLQCARCSLYFCRCCCTKSPTELWICSNCWKYRDITLQSGEWFYEQLKKRFHSTVATTPGNNNQDVEVREFLERIVEDMIGGELDSVSLRPISTHSDYVKFCETHHDELASLLAKYSIALQMTVSDKILPDSDSPSAIHEELKEFIKALIKEAMMLPNFQNFSNSSIKELLTGEVDDLESKSYEDILATAVINKVIERYQNELNNFDDSTRTNRDANGNVIRRKIRRRKVTAGVIERSHSSDSEISESTSFTNDEYSWSGSSKLSDPLSLTIEECIEEVVTKYSSDEERNSRDADLKHFLAGLNFKKRHRAPFPEFGMDVVDKGHSSMSSEDDNEEEEEDEAAVKVGVEVISPVESWEENWLFQRRRLKTACLTQSMPVPMLVPNPSEDEPRARIGDIDIDDTSDLSDCSDSALEDVIDGKDYSEPRATKSNLKLRKNHHQLSSSDDIDDTDDDDADDGFLLTYNRNCLKSLDDIKVNVTGICNGNITDEVIINRVDNNIINDENMQTELSHNNLDTVHLQSSLKLNGIVEAKNNELIVPQVDSGEGSLEMQQDREFSVEYDAPVQVHVHNENEAITNSSASQSLSPELVSVDSNKAAKPIPKPRSNTQGNKEESEATNAYHNGKEEKENFDIMIPLPKPGTIAEREILKWQKAVPLTNNPYSKENIEKRQRDRMLLSCQSNTDFSVEFPELSGANESSVVHIDCSGRPPDHKQYGRDYYINDNDKRNDERQEKEKDASMESNKQKKNSCDVSSVPHSKAEDEAQVSVRVEVDVIDRRPGTITDNLNNDAAVSSVETRTKVTDLNDSQHLTTISTTSKYNNENEKHHKVTTVSTWTNKEKSKDQIPLPSVKALAKQFSTKEKHKQNPVAVPQKKTEIVPVSPIKQIHSLTARCISKEFREGLRGVNPPKPDIKSIDKNENTSGNISDDSGTASPTPISGSNQKLCNSIAFWEQLKTSKQ